MKIYNFVETLQFLYNVYICEIQNLDYTRRIRLSVSKNLL